MSVDIPSAKKNIRGIDDIIQFIDAQPRIAGKAGVIWWLALGGLFLDAFSNSALSAGLNPMTRDLQLSATDIALLTSFSSWVAIIFNPVGGWIADRWGRVTPLIAAKICAVAGALLVTFSPDFSTIITGRFFVGIAYGMDFAVAMAMLAEFTPARLKSRLNTWQGVWYVAVCLNLGLALLFYSWNVGDTIWRYSIAVTAICGLIILVLQVRYLVESPVWLARRSRLSDAVTAMRKIYGDRFILAPAGEQQAIIGQAQKGIKNVLLIFRGVYLPRTILASTVQICQSIQYFGVGWYLPVISASLFGKNFVYATLGSLFFNIFGIVGGFLSPLIGRRIGLRRSSAIGFAIAFLVLLTLGMYSDTMPLWASLMVPALFILFHSGGPGANGKSLSSLSFRSELRAGANGIVGALGAIGAALGLFIFPIFREQYGLQSTFLIMSAVPLFASIVCFCISWDPTRSAIQPDNEPGAPQFDQSSSTRLPPVAQETGRGTK
ncbi:putative MFS family arabinose efflux permease [Raoultella sp. BIGb0149]|uniref:MFS transporter n=1 Tax=unclassified Raoultella TaxID=2627600 RepID=UPI00105ED991|nr:MULTISPECIES: MFS transporter [unclassified Raoultella]TDQ23509.1 putative MFS family arabinose efflux permease [Raoultella sp. BIGb0149]